MVISAFRFVAIIETRSKFFIFHSAGWENFATALDAKPRIIRILEEFIVIITQVIAFNMNPRITEVTLDSLIKISYIIFTNFSRKLYSRAHNLYS